MMLYRLSLLVLLGCLQLGCPQYGMISDGSSLSWGKANGGVLLDGMRLPASGPGFLMSKKWRTRGLTHGTQELVTLLVEVSEQLSRQPGFLARLGVGDMSLPTGGRSAHHRSHQTGRDVDLLFFAKANNKPLAPTTMYRFSARGTELSRPHIVFDAKRNWLLVKSLITSPVARVQHIFVADWLRQKLLDYAQATEEAPDLVLLASEIMSQPRDARPHDNHFHVRIYCAPSDRSIGCKDYGAIRWTKKHRKYQKRQLVTRLD